MGREINGRFSVLAVDVSSKHWRYIAPMPPYQSFKPCDQEVRLQVHGYEPTSVKLAIRSSPYDKTITFHVGKDTNQQDFQIHKGLVSHHSGFFDAVLNGSFSDTNRDSYYLPNVSVRVFEAASLWLYTRRIFDVSVPLDKMSACLLVLVYAFGDEHLMPGLCNTAIDTWRDILASDSTLEAGLCSWVYEKTQEGSNLRKWFVFMFSTGMLEFDRFLAIPYDNGKICPNSAFHKDFV